MANVKENFDYGQKQPQHFVDPKAPKKLMSDESYFIQVNSKGNIIFLGLYSNNEFINQKGRNIYVVSQKYFGVFVHYYQLSLEVDARLSLSRT